MVDRLIEDELRQLLHDRSIALIQGDVDFFRRHLSEEFAYTNASGRTFSKEEYISFFIESGQMQWQAQELDELEFPWHFSRLAGHWTFIRPVTVHP